MPELEVVLKEHLTQVQDSLRSNYRHAAGLLAEQRRLIASLQSENEDLRAKLASNRTHLAWGAGSLRGHDAAKEVQEASSKPKDTCAKSPARCSPSQEQADGQDCCTSDSLGSLEQPMDVAGSGKNGVTLPGEVAGRAELRSEFGVPRLQQPVEFTSTVQDRYTAILPDDKPDRFPVARRQSQVLKIAKFFSGSAEEDPKVKSGTAVFVDATAMKERVRQAIFKPEYHVTNYYKTQGFCQWVARSAPFDHLTLFVIAVNAFWLSIDSDWNTEAVILRAPLIFQIAEHGFCLYFTVEWIIRFMAFERKCDCIKDAWFIFDTCLVFLMVSESWVMASMIVVSGAGSNSGMGSVSVLKILRLLRLTRMARMAKLLRAMPELMILIKGISGAARSVFFTLVLLTGIIYIFAIAFRTLTDGTPVGNKYFSSVPGAMATLLLGGTLPDLEGLVNEVGAEHILYGILLLFFILLASLTVMNMLVGVLVEVVCTVSSVEKEQMEAVFLKGHMMNLLRGLDEDNDVRISKDEFGRLLEKPKAIKALQEVGVDVVGLAELSDFIYKDREELNFPDFMETVLQLRGTNTATVKSIVDVRMFMTKELARVEDTLLEKLHQIISVDLCHVICGVMTGDSEGLRKSLIALSSSAKIPLGSGNRSSGIELGSAGEGHLA